MKFPSIFRLIASINLLVVLLMVHNVKTDGIISSIAATALNLLGTKTSVEPADPCSEDETDMFVNVTSEFTNMLIGWAIDNNENHFVLSPYSIWMSLAAIAEGATDEAQAELYDILGLPTEICIRDALYNIAVGLEDSGDDVQFSGERLLVIDQHLEVNNDWDKFVGDSGLLAWKYEKLHPDSSEESESIEFSLPDIYGNSILYDTLNFEAAWTTAFSNIRKISDFHDENGKVIGKVELMTTTKQFRLGNLPNLDAKILELPVGVDGRYTMLIALGLTTMPIKQLMTLFQNSVITQVLSSLTSNLIPINIAIPEIKMSSDFETRPMLEDIGIRSLWNDPRGTRLITMPSVLPDNLYQSISISLDDAGVNPAPAEKADNIITGLLHTATSLTAHTASLIGQDFIANKPFTYCLLDTKTKAIIFAGVFSDPN